MAQNKKEAETIVHNRKLSKDEQWSSFALNKFDATRFGSLYAELSVRILLRVTLRYGNVEEIND